MNNKIIELPIFTWFYNSIHEFDYEYITQDFIQNIQDDPGCYPSELISLYNKMDESEKNDFCEMDSLFSDFYEIDYNQYKLDYSKSFVDAFNDNFEDDLKKIWITQIKFKGVSSPQYYNYSTDSLDVSCNICINKIVKYLDSEKEAFSKYIKKHNTSYDWYNAFYSNEYDSYIKELKEDESEACITQIMSFYISLLDDRELLYDLHYKVKDSVYEHEYISLINNK